MNPFVVEILTVLLRAGILYLAGVIGAQVSNEDAMKWAASGAVALAGVLWAIWAKYRSRKKLLTAMTLPPGSTEHEIEQAAKATFAPSVATRKSEVPL